MTDIVQDMREHADMYADPKTTDNPEMAEILTAAADEIERLGRCNELLSRSHAEAIGHQGNVIGQLRAALTDCMGYVDCDNLTQQYRHQCWQAVLDGKQFVRGNVKVDMPEGGE